jgi:hypothetical protein
MQEVCISIINIEDSGNHEKKSKPSTAKMGTKSFSLVGMNNNTYGEPGRWGAATALAKTHENIAPQATITLGCHPKTHLEGKIVSAVNKPGSTWPDLWQNA